MLPTKLNLVASSLICAITGVITCGFQMENLGMRKSVSVVDKWFVFIENTQTRI
jgi:hypothetical protein